MTLRQVILAVIVGLLLAALLLWLAPEQVLRTVARLRDDARGRDGGVR